MFLEAEFFWNLGIRIQLQKVLTKAEIFHLRTLFIYKNANLIINFNRYFDAFSRGSVEFAVISSNP